MPSRRIHIHVLHIGQRAAHLRQAPIHRNLQRRLLIQLPQRLGLRESTRLGQHRQRQHIRALGRTQRTHQHRGRRRTHRRRHHPIGLIGNRVHLRRTHRIR